MTMTTTATMSDSAQATVRRMQRHAVTVRAAWESIDRKLAHECVESCLKVLAQSLTSPGVELYSNSPLDLEGNLPSGVVFGVVAHRAHRGHEFTVVDSDLPHGLYCLHPETRHYHPLVGAEQPCEGGTAQVLPVPVTWATHS